MDNNCLYGIIGLTFAIVAIVAMFLGYKVKVDKKTATLEKNDRQHENKHYHNEERIKELEKKNGHELHKIEELQQQIKDLENQIKINNFSV